MAMIWLCLIMLVSNEVIRRKDSQVAGQPVNYLFGAEMLTRNFTNSMV